MKGGVKMNSDVVKVNKFNRAQVLSVFLFAFFYVLQLCLIGYAITYFQSKGISEYAGGVGVAIACAVATVLQPIFGNVADKVASMNWKKILYIMTAVSLVLAVVLYIRKSALTDIVLFCASIVLVLCMAPFVNESCFYYNSKEKPVSFGPARCGGSISYALVSYLIGYLLERISFDVIPITVIIADIGLIITLLLLPKVSDKTDKLELDSSNTGKQKLSLAAFIKRYKIFFVFFLALIFIFTFQNLFSANLINIVRQAGGDVETFGIVTAIAAIVELPTMFFFARLLKRFTSKQLMLFGSICYILRCILFLFAKSIAFVYMAQILQAVTFAIILPAMVYLSDETMSEDDKNSGQSIMTMTISIGTIIGFFLDGWLSSMGVSFVMTVGLVITIIGAILTLIAYILSVRHARGGSD